MNLPPALEISKLEKRHPGFTLGPLDLTVPSGTIYGLIGPNGAGKTTLIDTVFGMGQPDAGTIRVCGFDHDREEVAMKERAGYAGPELNFLAWGKVGKAIRFIRGFRPGWDEAYAAQLMKQFGLAMDDRIASLSFGSRTKLALLTALAWRPQALVLDEPTTGLDAHSKKTIFAELLAIVRDEGRAVFISSHQISDLERFSDRLAILHRGRLVAEGATGELVERHLQAEFTADAGHGVGSVPGLIIQEHDGTRWLGVLDLAVSSIEALASRGAREIQTQPLALEELFLALTK